MSSIKNKIKQTTQRTARLTILSTIEEDDKFSNA